MGKFAHQLDHHHHQNSNDRSQSRSCSNRGKKNPIKVTYISSPMKVKASNASEFRAIVQELTGKDSDVATAVIQANQVLDQRVTATAAAADDVDEGLIVSELAYSLDKFDDCFLWRDFSSGGSTFGFESTSASLLDYIFTAT